MSEVLVPEDAPVLHAKAKDVPKSMFGTPELAAIIAKMRQGLHAYNAPGYVGVAIAAPQVGEPYRLFLVEDMSKDRPPEEALPSFVAINPTITKRARKKVGVGEGCLSVPNHYGLVKRATNVTLTAYDETGAQFTRGAGGFLAQIIQHECDHLDGILFTDRAEKVFDKSELQHAPSEAEVTNE